MIYGPSRATAVRGFVGIKSRLIIACPVCHAHVGQACKTLSIYSSPRATSSHVPRTAESIAAAKERIAEVTKQPKRIKRSKVSALPIPANWKTGYGTNAGHGQVWRRPDFMKINCGGPRKCAQCKAHREYCIRYAEKLGIKDQL